MTLPLAANPVNLSPADLPESVSPGLYVHIPFCFHKCHYCDFYSITRQSEQRMRNFVERLLAEADLWAKSHLKIAPRTVFFGGGTPSLLPMTAMTSLIKGLRSRFDFSQLNEWTVEVNPATASAEYCWMLREAGIDRISMGAQSFNQHELQMLERHHNPDDVPRSIDLARSAGYSRLNIDLIYAIPGQTLESWQRSLESAISLGLSHYSCYGLTYEPNTPIAVRKRLGQFTAATDELELAMLHHARERMAAIGCPAYEISNYALPDQQCRHNLLYWTGGNYIGLGPSAASHLDGHRFRNSPHLGEWEQGIDQGRFPAIDYEILSPRQRAAERVMLGLRLTRGINFDDYSAETGFDARALFSKELSSLSQLGLISISNAAFCLTEAGLDVADSVAAQFLHSRSDTHPLTPT